MNNIQDKKLFLLDMDGTIYLGGRLFDGTKEFLSYVKAIGGRYAFLTNNSSRGTESYIEKLRKMGIEAFPEDFVTSADAAIDFMLPKKEELAIYICGTESLRRQFALAGFDVRTDLSDGINLLLLGYDTELTYKKLTDCVQLINRGCSYMATHPDMVCPTEYGFAPDCGSVIEMLRTATGKAPEKIFGKPQPAMAEIAMKKYGFSKEESCLVGDRLYTDIACAINAGISGCFVLSGEGKIADIEKYGVQPTFIFKDIKEILSALKGERK